MKKRFAFFVAASFICSCVCAQRYFEANDIRYRVITEADEASTYGTVSVAKPEVGEYEDDIKIPNVVKESSDQYADAYKVIGIDEKAFAETKYLESVELPASIENIGKEAFRKSSLKKIVIPVGNLTEIGESVFEETKLTSIEIPTTIKKIGNRAFAYCFDLAEVVIGDGLTDIGKESFMCCYSLESVTLPNSVRMIGDNCFWFCYRISKLFLGTNLKSIGGGAFYYCMSLRHVNLPEGLKEIGQSAFMNSGLVDIIIPESIREIRKYVFANSMLRSVVIPQRLRTIEEGAFYGLCLNNSVNIPEGTNVAQDAFENTTFDAITIQNERKMYLKNHQKEIVKEIVRNKDILMSRGDGGLGHDFLIIVNGIAYCPQNVPLNDDELGTICMCGGSYSVVIGRGRDSYGPQMKSEQLEGDIIIPDLIEVEDGLWKGKYIVTEIGSMRQCRTIKKLRIPLTIEKPFESGQFSESSITSVNIPPKIVDIPSGLFVDCKNLQEVSLPKNLKSIGDYAFARTLISSVIIPEGTMTIGERAFSQNRKLVDVTLPSDINIGRECFWGTPYEDNVENKKEDNVAKKETNIWDDPKYANDEEFNKYKKQLDVVFLNVKDFLENDKNLESFPSSRSYMIEYRRLYRQSLNIINADPWMKSLFNSSMNPYSSYTSKYNQNMESKMAKNMKKLP